MIKTLCPFFFSASYGSVTVWGALHILNPSFIPLEHQTPDREVQVLSNSWCNLLLEETLTQSVHPAGGVTEAWQGGMVTWKDGLDPRCPDF